MFGPEGNKIKYERRDQLSLYVGHKNVLFTPSTIKVEPKNCLHLDLNISLRISHTPNPSKHKTSSRKEQDKIEMTIIFRKRNVDVEMSIE